MPVCCTRIGAAHLRCGQPCQDAAATAVLSSGDGEAVAVMAVADGHGHPLHRLSQVGSRLACEVAIEAVRAEIGDAAMGGEEDLESWDLWLAEDLPVAIHTGWLVAIREHWEQLVEGRQEGMDGERQAPSHDQPGLSMADATGGLRSPWRSGPPDPFSPLLYGTTLGLVVMTPGWWGVTGIGDWDLLRLEPDGAGTLISEEDPDAAPGESTFSLCMDGASELFRERSALYAMLPGGPGFRLLLSTDGVRKSCRGLSDFVALAGHLAASADREDPGQDRGGVAWDGSTSTLLPLLDRITREGSGDDVSVALGRWMGELTGRL